MVRQASLFAIIVALFAACPAKRPPNLPPARYDNSPMAGAAFLSTERIPLKDGRVAEAQRGVVYVPLNRSDPSSRVIAIEVYRFPAHADVPEGRHPIFSLRGGPGWPGMASDLSQDGFYEQNIEPITRIADAVFVGQRGIGSSKPDTACQAHSPRPYDRRVSSEQITAPMVEASAQCKAYWDAQYLHLPSFNVIEAAADVDDVREALGYDRISLIGGSFGSHWGMAVMRYHPQIVVRAILTGMEGPDHTYDPPAGVLNALFRIAAAAEASQALQPHLPPGGLIEAYKQVIARLDANPVVVEIEHKGQQHRVHLGGDEIRELAYGYTRSTGSRVGIATWPRDIIALHRGDYTGAAREIMRSRLDGFMPPASVFLLDCGSGITRERLARYQSDPAAAVIGDINRDYEAVCPTWNVDLGDEFRTGFKTEIPTVIVQGDWDTSTPHENAVELAPVFEQSTLITIKGGSHGALGEALAADPAFAAALIGFMTTGDQETLPTEVTLPPVEWAVPEPASDSAGTGK